MRPSDVTDVLAHPDRRVITGEEQLADVVLEAIDDLSTAIKADSALRTLFWHRQRAKKGEQVVWIPNSENEFSTTFARMLRDRLTNVVVRREVEVQPGLGTQKGDNPDIEVTAKLDDGTEIRCPIEDKGNWHAEVETAVQTQLADRYLHGPGGRNGIYLVAWYGGSAWDPNDGRRQQALKRTQDQLTDTLISKAAVLSTGGIAVHVRLVDLTLETEDTPGA